MDYTHLTHDEKIYKLPIHCIYSSPCHKRWTIYIKLVQILAILN